ncbi:MAG: hypothetical protein N2484_08930 [Clostridia bacterium]|nr:hypothetical protein [Clostridia bacterium]
MGYYGVGGFRYQTLPLAPLPPIYDFTIKEVTAVPDKANSNSEIKLRTRIHAKVDGYSQIKNSIVLRGCVSQAGEYSTIISQSEWTKIGENNFEVIKDITVKTPNITVYGEVSLPAFVEVNPVDSRGEHPLKEPNYNDNSGHTEVTVISELKELRSVLREGYIGWWDTIPVTVQWTEWYWIVDITYCSGDKTHSSHTIDNSRWSAPSVQTNTRYYNGWNEAELDFVPLGYTGIESKQIPQHKGSGKMKILAPWATDSKSRNMYSGYSTIRSGYGFNADILAELNGTYRQTRSIHPDIVKTINLKMNTNCTKTPKVTQMEKISTSEIRHNQTKVDYNGLQADVLGTRWQNSILTPAMEIPKSYKKTADVVISDEIYEYKDTTRQLWKLPINAASKDKTRNADKARKIYIHIDEANGKYQLTGEGLFNNTKGLSTDHRYNRKDVFNLGIFEDMYYDTFPIDKTVEDEEE